MYISFGVLTCWLLLLSAKGLLSRVVGEPFEVAVMMMVTGKFPVSCLSSTEYTFSATCYCPPSLVEYFCFHSLLSAKALRWSQPLQKPCFMMTDQKQSRTLQSNQDWGDRKRERRRMHRTQRAFHFHIAATACITHGKKGAFS